MARPTSTASGFSEIVDTAGGTGTCIKQTTVTGETYVVNVATGEKVIPGSLRPDGTIRKPIKVRAGYTPVEERRAFKTRQQLSREERGIGASTSIPGLSPVEESESRPSTSSKPRRKKQNNDATNSTPRANQAAQGKARATDAEEDLCDKVRNLSIGTEEEQLKASDPSKRLRNTRKKINAIIELEKKIEAGDTPTPEQLEKIGRKAALLAEAAELEKALGLLE